MSERRHESAARKQARWAIKYKAIPNQDHSGVLLMLGKRPLGAQESQVVLIHVLQLIGDLASELDKAREDAEYWKDRIKDLPDESRREVYRLTNEVAHLKAELKRHREAWTAPDRSKA